MRIIIFIQIFSFFFSLTYSQDIKKVVLKRKNSQIVEEYFVLKSDKSIKNGSYLKYVIGLAGQKNVGEFGNFNHNKKSGVWFYFNSIHPQNPISIIGEYTDGQRTGRWAYFYPSEIKELDAFSILGFSKSTEIKSSNRDINISLDTSGLKLAAIGYFNNDKKVGRWSYYSNEGKVIKIHDFSTNREVYSFKNDSINLYLLGGFSRFQDEFTQIMFENTNELRTIPASEVTFEILTNEGNLYINNYTPIINNPFAAYSEKIVKKMTLYWTEFDPIFEKFSFIVNLKLDRKEGDHAFIKFNIIPLF